MGYELKMSWLRNNITRSNIRTSNRLTFRMGIGSGHGTETETDTHLHYDPTACYDSFKEHWQQASKIIQRSQHLPNHDDVLGVVNHLEQMVALLLYDVSGHDYFPAPMTDNTGAAATTVIASPCLEYLLSENILHKLYEWGVRTGRYVNAVRLEQLKLYEMLVSHSRQQLLVHEPFLRPLLKLLMSCLGEFFPEDVEKLLVLLLNQLCVLLMQNIDLLDLFFCTTSEDNKITKFIIFSLLIPFIHREGAIGMQARDALLLCMSLSKKNKNIGVYIAEHSNICVLLASGLSGLYSVLPHILTDIESDDWHRFTPDDVKDIKDLEAFMNSLEFCNAVAQVAHPLIKEQLHEFLYRGFLIPVMGPALLQNTIDEQIAATAYFDLLLRSATEPGLLKSLIKFLLEVIYDGKRILHILILRIKDNTRLSMVSLALFETLVDINCEDIMLELVFQYLKPCMHLMTSQLKLLNDFDPYCENVEKLLYLTPVCCIRINNMRRPSNENHSPRTSVTSMEQQPRFVGGITNWNHYSNPTDTLYGNYHAYLCDARNKIAACKIACSGWINKYNGHDSPPKKAVANERHLLLEEFDAILSNNSSATTTKNCVSESNGIYTDESTPLDSLQSLGESSSDYESLKLKSDDNNQLTNNVPVWQMSRYNENVDKCERKLLEEPYEQPSIGLFLNVIFDKLETMLSNNVYVNLHLTGLFSRLAVYSNSLLRTYLLNYKLVLQPNVRSLYQVIGALKQRIDEFMNQHIDAEHEIKQAKLFLMERETKLLNARRRAIENSNSTTPSVNNSLVMNDPFKRDETKRRSITSSLSSMFRRASHTETGSVILLTKKDDERNEALLHERTLSASHNSLWYNEKSEVKNYALCALILEEWLKELAALSQEHTIAQLTTTVH